MKKIFLLFMVLSTVLYAGKSLNLQNETQKALKSNKLILLSVESENCPYCIKMHDEVFSAKKYTKQINSHYVQKIVTIQDVKLPDGIKVEFFPTNLILDPKNMAVVDEFIGYMKADDFLPLLSLVYEQERMN